MFKNTAKAQRGLSFLIGNYENYRLRFEYDEEANPYICLYRVTRNLYGVEQFSFVAHIDTTSIYEQCADIALKEGLELCY